MTRLLVTGGAGFIGSNFVRFALRARTEIAITNLDLLTYSGNMENLASVIDDPRHRFVKGDVCDTNLASELIRDCDAVVHLAAESHVDRSLMDARPFVRTNVLGTQSLLDAAARVWEKGGTRRGRFILVSTDEVYGSLPLDATGRRFTEESPLRPSTPYAATKACADMLTLAAHASTGLDVVVARCGNNFGPFQFPEKLIPLFVTNLIAGKHVPLYGDGLNVRDWIHVDDHCEALLALLDRGRAGEVYNIGAHNEVANIDITRVILREMGMDESFISYVSDRPGHDRRYALATQKIEREVGWRASRSAMDAALPRTIEWYKANETWWRRILSGEHRAFQSAWYKSLGFVG